ncbi:MAG TPA: 6-phosphogluconolactonase [Actinomycetota bacterium]|nr:6-phosphogluconolactonase [Actinomycetota bacterium]
MDRTLIVTDDLAATALGVFLGLAPRTVALSGGSTPEPVYERLAGLPYPWEEVDFFFVDERCVPADHPDSNVGMAERALLSKVPARAHRIDGAGCDAEAYDRRLRGFGDPPVLDLALLGLGEDGHVASLYPGDAALDVTGAYAVRVPEPGMPPAHPRVTMTMPVLSAARASVFLVSGESKREPLSRLLADDGIPAARVASERVVVLATPDAT